METDPPKFISQQVTDARRFYLNLKPRRTRELTVVCGGLEECAPDYAIDRDTFPYFSIEFVAAGGGELALNGRRHTLEPGAVFTYGPGVKHKISTSPQHPLRKYFVDFCGNAALRLLRECQLAPGTIIHLGALSEVRGTFDTLVRLGSNHHRHTARICALQTELLILILARSGQPGPRSARRSLATFERCRRIIDESYLNLATLEHAAAACHVEASYLCRLFRQFQGVSPFRYLQRLKMQWAAERLQSSGKFIHEVADELHLDPFLFSRIFKRIHGLSPSAFLSVRV